MTTQSFLILSVGILGASLSSAEQKPEPPKLDLAFDLHLDLGKPMDIGKIGPAGMRRVAPVLGTANEAVLQLLEDPLHDARHTRQDKDIADLEPRGTRDRVGEKRGALGNHRHPQARLIQMTGRVMGFEQPLRLGMHDQR